jgi:hypothetical protein
MSRAVERPRMQDVATNEGLKTTSPDLFAAHWPKIEESNITENCRSLLLEC